MFDNLMTATEVRQKFGAAVLRTLQLEGPDRTEHNQHSKKHRTQLYVTSRVETKAIKQFGASIGVGEVPFLSGRAYRLGLYGLPDTGLTPDQRPYFEAGAKARARHA